MAPMCPEVVHGVCVHRWNMIGEGSEAESRQLFSSTWIRRRAPIDPGIRGIFQRSLFDLQPSNFGQTICLATKFRETTISNSYILYINLLFAVISKHLLSIWHFRIVHIRAAPRKGLYQVACALSPTDSCILPRRPTNPAKIWSLSRLGPLGTWRWGNLGNPWR